MGFFIYKDEFQKNIILFSVTKELEVSREEAMKAVAETERLLQLVAMSQEEQSAKEKTILDLQQ